MFSRFWKILGILGFLGKLKSEWVELPKLDPWAVEGTLEPVKHFIPVDSKIYPNSQKVTPSSVDESYFRVSTLPMDSSRWDGILEMEDSLAGPAQHPTDTVVHLQVPAYQLPMMDQGNESVAKVDISSFETEGLRSAATKRPTFGPTELPKEPTEGKTMPPPNQRATPPRNDYYPNKTYTYMDPLIESLMLKVHQTLISQAGQPIRQKVHYLQSLQNNLLNQIWKRSQRLWVIEGSEARGQEMMTFPSLEGALLTISFLTFAVFLIKIVKQFIQGMQGQNATMIEVPIPNRRHRREAFVTQSELILKMIEEFHLQHAS